MRKSLSHSVGEQVLVLGFLDAWFTEDQQVRVCLKQPVIKKADREKLFDDQKLISKEHHINVFCSEEYWQSTRFTRYQKIQFGGHIYRYERKNGSIDYGVKSIRTYQVEEAVEYLQRITQTALDNLHGDDLITLLDREIIPAINASLATIEASGDLLPTFYRTYSDYLKILNGYLENLERLKDKVITLLRTRSYRRFCQRRHKKESKRNRSNKGFCSTIKKLNSKYGANL